MRVVGLDLSLSSTGIATSDTTWVVGSKARSIERLIELRETVLDVVCWTTSTPPVGGHSKNRWPACDLVVIEGYSMGTARQSSHAHALGELGGVVRVALVEHGVPYVDVPPASLKTYATGKGNANKGMVLEAASKRSGLDFGGDHNRSDAFWLWAMGMDALGEAPLEMPATHRRALAKVAWPVGAQGVAS